jgi:hypothetical protein
MIPAALRSRYAVSQEPLRSERRLELALLGAALLIGVLLIVVLLRLTVPARVTSIEPAADSLQAQHLVEPRALSSSESLLLRARPVFWASRRPLEPVTVEAAPDAEEESAQRARALRQLEVTGVLVNGSGGSAIVSYKGQIRRLPVGADLDGWTLVELREDAVVFAGVGGREVHRLTRRPVAAGANTDNGGRAANEPAAEAREAAPGGQQRVRLLEARRRALPAPAEQQLQQQQQQQPQQQGPARLTLGGSTERIGARE